MQSKYDLQESTCWCINTHSAECSLCQRRWLLTGTAGAAGQTLQALSPQWKSSTMVQRAQLAGCVSAVDWTGGSWCWVIKPSPSLCKHHNIKSFYKTPETCLQTRWVVYGCHPYWKAVDRLTSVRVTQLPFTSNLNVITHDLYMLLPLSYVALYSLTVINLLSSFIRLARSVIIDFHSLYYSSSSHLIRVYLILPAAAKHSSLHSILNKASAESLNNCFY